MKFYTYRKETKKKNLPYQSFQFFIEVVELKLDDFKCSLVHYGMIMLMIMIF
jgi:hypothetical protein